MSINVSVPHFECFVRSEYLHDFKSGHGEFLECVVFGASSLLGRAVGFHVLLRNGAQIGRLPVSALAHSKDARVRPLDHLQLWNAFSYSMSVHEYEFLSGARCAVKLKDGKTYEGNYRFTFDWHGSEFAESAGDLGWKCAHFIALDSGDFCLQPNNRCAFAIPAFTDAKLWIDLPEKPKYRTMSRTWDCENMNRWGTTDEMLYGIETAAKAESRCV